MKIYLLSIVVLVVVGSAAFSGGAGEQYDGDVDIGEGTDVSEQESLRDVYLYDLARRFGASSHLLETLPPLPDAPLWLFGTILSADSGNDESSVQWVAVGEESTILTSSDGIEWTPQGYSVEELQSFGVDNLLLSGVTWAGDKWVIVGGYLVAGEVDSVIQISDNGMDWWEVPDLGTGTLLRSVVFTDHEQVGRNRLVVVGGLGTILTSPDGDAWTEQTSHTNKTLSGITWTGSQFVVVGGVLFGGSGVILTSNNGKDWVVQDLQQVEGILRSVIEFPGQGEVEWLVAVGDDGTILTSFDAGARWERQTSVTDENLNSVVWTGSELVAVGGGPLGGAGTILTSPDGIVWERRTLRTGGRLDAISRAGDRLITVGEAGMISIFETTAPDNL